MSTEVLSGESTKTSPALSVLIPCYNEQEGLNRMASELAPVLLAMQALGPTEVVFVDDGSSDGTWQGLATLAATGLAGTPVQVVRHDRNRGLGAALRTGFAACRGQVIVTTDSDSTYRFDEIPRLLSLLEGDVAVVTASQYHPAGRIQNVPTHRLILSRGASTLYRTLVSRKIHTYTSLFRAYRSSALEHIGSSSDGFLAVSELLVNAIHAGYRVVEYPTTLHSRVEGTSKARLARTTALHLSFMAGLLLQRLHLRPMPYRRAPTPFVSPSGK